MSSGTRLSLAGLVLFAAGCSTVSGAPPAQIPSMPGQWSESEAGAAGHPIARAAWWELFGDSQLDSLVERALQDNLDLQLAEARVREARAREGVAAAGLTPSIDTMLSVAREKESANAPRPVLIAPDGRLESSAADTENIFRGGFDARWELDVFGSRRWAVRAAHANTDSRVYDRDAAIVTLIGEVTRNYIELRGLQRRIALARASLSSDHDALELVRSRHVGGLASELDVARAQAQSTDAQLPALEVLQKAAMHRLSVLVGVAPEALTQELSSPSPVPRLGADLPVGVPSDLLRQRPDIRSAEQGVAAAFARSKAAAADLFPKFSIVGAIGLASIAAGDFFDSSSSLWRIGPSITWPIFEGGRLKSTIQVRDAQEQQALIVYRRAILAGLEDVENALAKYRREKDRTASLAKAVEATRRARDLARSLYVGGLSDFRDLVRAQRDLAGAEADLAQSETATSVDVVALAKALGGGWDAVALPPGVSLQVDTEGAPTRSVGGSR